MNKNTYDTSSIKRVTRKFLEVSRCSREKQRQRNVQKKVCCTCKVGFLLIRPIVVFSPFSLPSPLRITLFYILFEQTLNIIEGFVFSPGQIYILFYAFITIKLLFGGCKAPRTTSGCEHYKSV